MRGALLGVLAPAMLWASGPLLVFEPHAGGFVARAPRAAFAFRSEGIDAGLGGVPARLTFPGSRADSVWRADSPSAQRVNSFVGPPSRWQRDLATYQRLRRDGLYPHVDLVAHASGRQLEFDFVVHPGGDTGQIRLRFEGAQALRLDGQGSLIAGVGGGELRQRPPVAYQLDAAGVRVAVASRFQVRNAFEAAFVIGDYDPQRDLVIDPIVEGLSYLGGSGDDEVVSVDGNLICGSSPSLEFLAGLSQPDATRATQGRDVYLRSGLNVTYFGGSGDDRPTACASIGPTVLVAGTTTSADFPAGLYRGGARLESRPGLRTGFRAGEPEGFLAIVPLFSGSWIATFADPTVTAVAADFGANLAVATAITESGRGQGSRLTLFNGNLEPQASTVIDGEGDDRIDRLQFFGELFAAGSTNSPDVAGQPTQGRDAFLLQLAVPSLQVLARRRYGGSGDEAVFAMAFAGNSIWLAGATTSPDLPLAEAWQSQLAGGSDGFAVAFTRSTFALRRSSYHGGTGDDRLTAILPLAGDGRVSPAIASGSVWLAGVTNSVDLPVAGDADQPRFAGGLTDAFCLAVASASKPPSVSSYLGGAGDDEAVGFTGGSPLLLVGNTTAPLDLPLIPGRSYRAGREGFEATLATSIAREIVLGRGLRASYSLPVRGVTVRSSDPGRLLVSAFGVEEPRPSVTLDSGGVALHGQADSGSAELIIEVPGREEERIPVRLVPAGFAILQGPSRLTVGASTVPRMGPAALDPESGEVLAEQGLSRPVPGLTPVLQSSAPGVLSVGVADTVAGVSPGVASLTVVQPAGLFRQPAPLSVSVERPSFRFTCPALGHQLRSSGSVGTSNFRPTLVRLTVEEGPVRLTFASNRTDTFPELLVNSGSLLWFDTLETGSVVRFRLEADGFETQIVSCPVYPSEWTLAPILAVPLQAMVGVASQISLEVRIPGIFAGSPPFPRPTAAAQAVRIEVSGAPVDVAPVTLARDSPGTSVSFTPREAGRARLVLQSPPGTDAAARTLEVDVRPRAPFTVSGPIVVGRLLSMPLSFSTSPASRTLRLTLRGEAFLLRPPGDSVGRPEVSVNLVNGFATVTLEGGDAVGTSALQVAWDDGESQGQVSFPVETVPASLGWLNPAVADLRLSPWQSPFELSLVGQAAGPFGVLAQPLSAALNSALRFEVSPPALAEVVRLPATQQTSSVPRVGLQALAAGLAEISFVSPLPATPGRDRLRARILPPRLTLQAVTVGAHLVAQTSLRGEPRSNPRLESSWRVRLTSSNPDVLLLSATAGQVGQASVEITATQSDVPYFVHGIAPGTAVISAQIAGGEAVPGEPVTLPVFVLATGVRFGVGTSRSLELSTTEASFGAELTLLNPTRLTPVALDGGARLPLRPGLEPLRVAFTVEPPGVLEVSPAPFIFPPGSVSAGARFRPLAVGRARLSLVAPPGFATPSDGSATASIEVLAPRLSLDEIRPLGRDLLANTLLRVSDGRGFPAGTTVTSRDPSRLLLSLSQTEPGRAQVTISTPGNVAAVFLHGLAADGQVVVTAEAPGLTPISQTVSLLPTSLSFTSLTSPIRLSGSTSSMLMPQVPGGFSLQARPGAGLVSLRALPAGIVEVPAQVRLGQLFEIKGLAVGAFRLEATPPEGFSGGVATVNGSVALGELLTSGPSRLGKDLAASFTVFAGGILPAFTVTSDRPDLALVSDTAEGAGQASVSLSRSNSFFVRALASSGVVRLTVASPGFAPLVVPIELVPSGFVLADTSSPRTVSAGATERVLVRVASLDPVTLRPLDSLPLRPGLTRTPALASSDVSVVSVTRRSNSPSETVFDVVALRPGRARLTVAQPEGFTVPLPAQTVDYEVTDAFFSFDPPRVAHQLRVTATLRLTPAQQPAVPVQIVSRSPDRVAVSAGPDAAAGPQATVNASGGVATFYLDGLADSGSALLAVSAPGYRPFEIDLTLQPAGFLFAETAATVGAFSPWRVPVRVAPVSAFTGLPFSDFQFFGDGLYRVVPALRNATLTFSVTGNTGLRLASLPLGGQTNWLPTAAFERSGNATVTVVAPPGFATPARGQSVSVIVQ